MKLISYALMTLMLSGCGIFGKGTLTTETIEVRVPVIYSPPPPVIPRPDLAIHNLTEEQKNDAGTLAQYYKITVIQLLGYTEELEAALDEYLKISESLGEAPD